MTTTERCPWCGSVIRHGKFVKIQHDIREEEKRKFAVAENDLRMRIEKELTAKLATKERQLAADRMGIDDERRKLATAEKQLRTRIEKEFTAKLSAQEQKLAAERKSVAEDREKIAEERRSLATITKRQVELAKQNAEKQRLKDLAETREILQKDKDDALLKRKRRASHASAKDGRKRSLS